MSQNFPFIRITVLGPTESGKTSLISSYVNNGCQKQYSPTLCPELYYRILHMPPENDPKGPLTSVCVEIEDTPPPINTKDLNSQTPIIDPMLSMTEGPVENHDTKFQSITRFFDMTRHNVNLHGKAKDFVPFKCWKPPQVPATSKNGSFSPLTQGRMGFMIVFDVTNVMSFETACEIYSALWNSLEVKRVRVRPYISFIATKSEQEPYNEDSQRIISMAEAYTQQRFIRLIRVSAWTGKNIKRAFSDLISLIVGNHMLWEIDPEETVHELRSRETKEENQSGCMQS